MLKPEEIVVVREAAIAIHQTLSGQFDDKIAEFKAEQAKLADLAAKADTVKKAQKVRDDADKYAAKLTDEAHVLKEEALRLKIEYEDKLASLNEEKAVLRESAEQHQADMRNLEDWVKTERAAIAKEWDRLNTLRAELDTRSRELGDQAEALYNRQQAFAAKVQAIQNGL